MVCISCPCCFTCVLLHVGQGWLYLCKLAGCLAWGQSGHLGDVFASSSRLVCPRDAGELPTEYTTLGPETLGPRHWAQGTLGPMTHLIQETLGTKSMDPRDTGTHETLDPRDIRPKDNGPKDNGPKRHLDPMDTETSNK